MLNLKSDLIPSYHINTSYTVVSSLKEYLENVDNDNLSIEISDNITIYTYMKYNAIKLVSKNVSYSYVKISKEKLNILINDYYETKDTDYLVEEINKLETHKGLILSDLIHNNMSEDDLKHFAYLSLTGSVEVDIE